MLVLLIFYVFLLLESDLGRPWTIYEAYQFIILAQADSFIKLGLPETLKVCSLG